MPTKMTKGQPCQADLSPETSGLRPVALTSAVSNLVQTADSSQVTDESRPVSQVIIEGKAYLTKAARTGSNYESVTSELRAALLEAGLLDNLGLVVELLGCYYKTESGEISIYPKTQEHLGRLIGKSAETVGRRLRALEKAGIIEGVELRGENPDSPYGVSLRGKAYLVHFRKARKAEQATSVTMTASSPVRAEARRVEASGNLSAPLEITQSTSVEVSTPNTAGTGRGVTSTASFVGSLGANLTAPTFINDSLIREGFNQVELTTTSAARNSSRLGDVALISEKQLPYLISRMPASHQATILREYGLSSLSELTSVEARALLNAYEDKAPELWNRIDRKAGEYDLEKNKRAEREQVAKLEAAKANKGTPPKAAIAELKRKLDAATSAARTPVAKR